MTKRNSAWPIAWPSGDGYLTNLIGILVFSRHEIVATRRICTAGTFGSGYEPWAGGRADQGHRAAAKHSATFS